MKVEAHRLELDRDAFHHKIEQNTYKYMGNYGIDFSFFFKQDMPTEYKREADIIDMHEFFLPWGFKLINNNKNVVVNVLESNIHSLKPWVEKNSKIFDKIKKKVKAFVGKTEWNRQLLESLGVPKEKTTCIPYAVDLDFWKPQVAKDWGLLDDDYSDHHVILFASSFSEGKGCLELLEQFRRTCLGRRVLLVMTGGGTVDYQQVELEHMIMQNNLGRQVKIIPYANVSFNMLPRLFSTADLFIIPQGGQEPMQFSQPMLWAMGCGKPLLSLDRGCATSMIDNGVNGYRCSSYDEIGAWMSKLCSSDMDAERRNMGRESRAKAEREFSPEVTSRKYAELYKWVLDK